MIRRLASCLLVVVAGAAAVPGAAQTGPQLVQSEGEGARELASLPANQWVVFHAPAELDWRRQGHGGVGYDSKRGTLLLFGSDTHGENWDNSVHEFDPATKTWTTHYPPADPSTYRADPQGNRISGPPDRLLPWAMHTFDNVVYDPSLDALIVTGAPAHNSIADKVPDARRNPVWIYDLGSHQWRIFDSEGRPAPIAFAGASAYDSQRDVIVVYGGNGSGTAGVFELGPDRKQWHEVAGVKHEIHFNMDYDERNGVMAVFGNWGNSNTVWIYRPGATAGKLGRWEEHVPQGDICPPGQTLPVAYDKRAGVFLLVSWGVTCVYDPARDRYTVLPDAKIPALVNTMNYNMVYDERHGVFLVVTGQWQAPPVVWALRLDLGAM